MKGICGVFGRAEEDTHPKRINGPMLRHAENSTLLITTCQGQGSQLQITIFYQLDRPQCVYVTPGPGWSPPSIHSPLFEILWDISNVCHVGRTLVSGLHSKKKKVLPSTFFLVLQIVTNREFYSVPGRPNGI